MLCDLQFMFVQYCSFKEHNPLAVNIFSCTSISRLAIPPIQKSQNPFKSAPFSLINHLHWWPLIHFPVSVDLLMLNISNKWNHIYLWSAITGLFMHCVLKGHLCYSKNQYFVIYYIWVIFHSMDKHFFKTQLGCVQVLGLNLKICFCSFCPC